MRHAVIVLLGFAWLTPQMVSDQCVTEASFAVRECACTVHNRLQAGWSEYRVLDAYFSIPGRADAAQVATVAAVLSGTVACGLEYFMYSKEDVRYLGIGHYTPVRIVHWHKGWMFCNTSFPLSDTGTI